jgi:hypothetical protein
MGWLDEKLRYKIMVMVPSQGFLFEENGNLRGFSLHDLL